MPQKFHHVIDHMQSIVLYHYGTYVIIRSFPFTGNLKSDYEVMSDKPMVQDIHEKVGIIIFIMHACSDNHIILQLHFQSQQPMLRIDGSAIRCGDKLQANFTLKNAANVSMVNWSIQFNENT